MLSFRVAEKATFLNRIIQNFHGKAQASYATGLNQREAEWRRVLEKVADLRQCLDEEKLRKKKIDPKTFSDSAIWEALREDYLNAVRSGLKKPEKGKHFTFRINNNNRDMLEGSRESDLEIYATVQDYIKALLEEYASLSYYNREEIFYKDLMEEIQMYIDTNKLIEIRKGDTDKGASSKKSNALQLVPYRIIPDKARNYHYLIGVLLQKDKKTNLSLRISDIGSIRKIHALTSSERLDSKYTKELDKLLVKKGAAFIGMPSVYSIVKLTPKGINMYRRMLFLRPPYIKIYNQNEYLFDCTTKQLEFYFFKFGKEAVIIGPSGIRKYFHKEYSKASEVYEKEPEISDAAFCERVNMILNLN